jgi:hypothetical protein
MSKVPSLRFPTCSCLRIRQLPASLSMTLKRSRTISLRCDLGSVAAREVFLFVVDAARTKRRANFAGQKIGFVVAVRGMHHWLRAHQSK